MTTTCANSFDKCDTADSAAVKLPFDFSMLLGSLDGKEEYNEQDDEILSDAELIALLKSSRLKSNPLDSVEPMSSSPSPGSRSFCHESVTCDTKGAL